MISPALTLVVVFMCACLPSLTRAQNAIEIDHARSGWARGPLHPVQRWFRGGIRGARVPRRLPQESRGRFPQKPAAESARKNPAHRPPSRTPHPPPAPNPAEIVAEGSRLPAPDCPVAAQQMDEQQRTVRLVVA